MTALRYCGRCHERGWIQMAIHVGKGEWIEHKGLCPECNGTSARDFGALKATAERERWYRIRYDGTAKRAWWAYDWARDRYIDQQHGQESAA